MFRKIELKIKEYNENNISITRLKDVDEEVSIGDWDKSYPFLKLVYNTNLEVIQKYTYLIRYANEIIGYFIAADFIHDESNNIIQKEERKMVLLDFAIYAKQYDEYGKILFDYLLNLAKLSSCKVVEIKNISGYEYFYEFLKYNYDIKEDNDNFYILIDKPSVYPNGKNLKTYENDSISLENLYFLYGLKFVIFKNKCIYKHKSFKIIVDRKTGIITFPKNIICRNKEIVLNDKTRNLIYFICVMRFKHQEENIYLKINDLYEVYYNNELVVFSSFSDIEKNYAYLNRKYVDGYDYIHSCFIKFDYHHLSYEKGYKKIDIRNSLKSKIKYLDINSSSLKETGEKLKVAEKFNKELNNIKRLDFKMGNPFSGIKKFTILFDDEVLIKHNGLKKEDIYYDKDTLIKELKKMYFINWKKRYFNNPAPSSDNIWHLLLTFEDKVLEYEGVDDYPNVWIFFIEFINKYSSIPLRESNE